MNKELPKVYEPQQVESRIYQMWEEQRLLQGRGGLQEEALLHRHAAPNVTGQLHMGHALDCTLQDILTRFKRMQGLRRPVGPRHRPRRHRHPDQGGGRAAGQGGQDPL